jgi:hypothetical protein
LRGDLPPALLRWTRDFHNSFHGGAGVSFLEVMKSVASADAAWSAFAAERGIQSKDHSAETRCFEFLNEKFPCTFSSMSQFKAARAMNNKLVEAKWNHELNSVIGEICDFRHKSLNPVSVLLNLHILMSNILRYKGSPHLQDDDLRLFAFEAAKFMAPS